jgi:hypothetical protein
MCLPMTKPGVLHMHLYVVGGVVDYELFVAGRAESTGRGGSSSSLIGDMCVTYRTGMYNT